MTEIHDLISAARELLLAEERGFPDDTYGNGFDALREATVAFASYEEFAETVGTDL